MTVELLNIPAMPVIRLMADTPEEETTCNSIVSALKGTNIMVIEVEVDGRKGISIPAKRLPNGKKPENKKTPPRKTRP